MRLGTLHAWDVATGKLAAPLRPELKTAGGRTQSLGIAGERVVVCGQSLYSVVDLSVLLPEIGDEASSVLRRVELATNQKLLLGELVPLELSEWNDRWEQLAGTRTQGEAAANDVSTPATSPTNNAKQPLAGAVAQAKAAGLSLFERLQALRPPRSCDTHSQFCGPRFKHEKERGRLRRGRWTMSAASRISQAPVLR